MEYRLKRVLKNKKCLVTGASRGIGRSIVRNLLEVGAVVIATASQQKNLKALKHEFSQYGENLIIFDADLSVNEEVQHLCRLISSEVGDVDVLINNAGILCLESLENSTEEMLRKSFEVNYFSAFTLCRHFSPAMIKNNRGDIVNMCSSSAYTGGGAANHSIYASTKHALLGLSRALDEELRSYNIRVATVSPAGVSTEMMTGRGDLDHSSFMTPDEVADAVMYLLQSDGAGIVYEMRMWRKDR